jgi:hypothetical protein
MRGNLSEDRDAYREIAENLATYRVYGLGKNDNLPSGPNFEPRPTAYRPPLYPVLLAKLAGEGLEVTPLRVAILHWLLGIGTVGLTWVVAEKLAATLESGVSAVRGEPRHTLLPVVASLLVACDPILLHWSTYVMTETLATFLAVLALYTLFRFHFDRRPMNAGLVGCAMGLAVLSRPTFLPWAGLCGLSLLFLPASGGRQPSDTSAATEAWPIQLLRRAANLAVYGLIVAIVVSPWGYRNYQQFGKPIITTTHGGYTLLLANNNVFYNYLRCDDSGLPWDPMQRRAVTLEDGPIHFEERMRPERLTGLFRKGIGEDARSYEEILDGLLYEAAFRDITAQPIVFAYSCLYRVAQLWSPLPHKLTADESWKRAILRYATCAWYFAVYAAVIAGIWKLRGKLLRSPWVWGGLLCLVFTGVHTFYWSNMRMRAPLMPFVAVLAAVGACSFMSRLRRESLTEARRHKAAEK